MCSAKTYEAIQHIIREATAINVLLSHVAEVKAQAEDTIIIANRRIAEEIKKVPKATMAGPGLGRKQTTAAGKLFSGRALSAFPALHGRG